MNISLILKGMAMGMAEAIPGVSGGTIAFITGIYERLLRAIGAILGTQVAGTFRREGLRPAWWGKRTGRSCSSSGGAW